MQHRGGEESGAGSASGERLGPERARGLRGHRGLGIVAGLLLAAAAVGSLVTFGLRLAYEWRGLIRADTAIYWAVGRGITEGLMPYRDLFETKPPGIFLLSALSLWSSGSFRLTHMAQALVLAIVPAVLIAWVWRAQRGRSLGGRWAAAAALVPPVVLLTLYLTERSGQVQTESFGAAAAIAYLGLASWPGSRPGRRRDLVAGLLLLAACGMKEPFLLTIVAGLLVLGRRGPGWRRFAVHVALATMGGVGALWLVGWLEPFFGVYLHEMVGRHVHQVHDGAPLWLRSLFLPRIAADLHRFSPFLIPVLLWLLLAPAALEGRGRDDGGGRSAVLGIPLALLLVGLSVGLGGQFYDHHFAFAVPFYAAILLSAGGRLASVPAGRRWIALGGCAALGGIGLLARPEADLEARLQAQLRAQIRMQRQAASIDSVLAACGEDRYLFLGPNGHQPYAFTTHPPLGPLFFQLDDWLDASRPDFRAVFAEALRGADVIVFDQWRLGASTRASQAYVEEHFSEKPWPCAEGFDAGPLRPKRLLFRVRGEDRLWGAAERDRRRPDRLGSVDGESSMLP